MSLKDIAKYTEADLLKSALDDFGVTQEEFLTSQGGDQQKLKELAQLERKHLVNSYLMTKKGRKELRESIIALVSKRETARDHLALNFIVRKIKNEAGHELLKLGTPEAEFVAFNEIIRGAPIGKIELEKGSKLFEEAAAEIEKLGDFSDPTIIVDILMETPGWIHAQMEKLDRADKLFYEAIPGHKFISGDQIRGAYKIIFGKEWTSGHSVRYLLKAWQMQPLAGK